MIKTVQQAGIGFLLLIYLGLKWVGKYLAIASVIALVWLVRDGLPPVIKFINKQINSKEVTEDGTTNDNTTTSKEQATTS